MFRISKTQYVIFINYKYYPIQTGHCQWICGFAMIFFVKMGKKNTFTQCIHWYIIVLHSHYARRPL